MTWLQSNDLRIKVSRSSYISDFYYLNENVQLTVISINIIHCSIADGMFHFVPYHTRCNNNRFYCLAGYNIELRFFKIPSDGWIIFHYSITKTK